MNVRGVSSMGGGSVVGSGISRNPARRRRWRRDHAPALRLFTCLLLTIAVLLADARSANAWQVSVGQADGFSNPPLQYDGPDPTAGYFMPAKTAMLGTNDSTPPAMSPAFETVPPADLGAGAWLESPTIVDDPWAAASRVSSGVTDHKDGFFQKLSVTETWIDRDGAADYGFHEIDTYVMVAVPAPSRESPLLISPTFNVRLLDGPFAPDLPPQLYEAYIDFMWLPKISPRWTGIISVAPSYYSDFEASSDEAFRLTGRGLAKFDWIPDRMQVLFGVLYLNRNDIRLLPAGGIIWTPNDAKRYEILFPKPKLAHRITVGCDFEDWLYLGGEFGGNSYAIERVSGAADVITLRDIRAYIGLERKKNGGAGYFLEIGYVFARRVEYSSATPDIHGEDAAMLRGGLHF